MEDAGLSSCSVPSTGSLFGRSSPTTLSTQIRFLWHYCLQERQPCCPVRLKCWVWVQTTGRQRWPGDGTDGGSPACTVISRSGHSTHRATPWKFTTRPDTMSP